MREKIKKNMETTIISIDGPCWFEPAGEKNRHRMPKKEWKKFHKKQVQEWKQLGHDVREETTFLNLRFFQNPKEVWTEDGEDCSIFMEPDNWIPRYVPLGLALGAIQTKTLILKKKGYHAYLYIPSYL